MSGNRREHESKSTKSILKLYSIFEGEVVSVQEYGAFVKIPNHHKNGLVHRSQISSSKVEDAKDVLNVGEKVFCKVISLGEDNDKIALSMKCVNQGSGKDQDPNHLLTIQDEQRRKFGGGYVKPKIELGAIYNTNCRQCGGQGHIASDCFQAPGSKTYDLIPDIDLELPPPEVIKAPHHHKKKKKEKMKKHKRTKHYSETDSSSEDDEPKKKSKHKKNKKSKSSHKHTRSSSDSDDSSSNEPKRKSKHEKNRKSRTSHKRSHSSSDSDDSSSSSDERRRKKHKKDKKKSKQKYNHQDKYR
ncbi:nucleolar protein of 40 kDa-like [Anneissia japonica]|uniref:nucleolar protein of 40 kDa-like n=1 Tax=Anneissia japonica TaxID=1529436 RepID=UPI0014259CD3|nr:nucleolar protein of 40 kDa-like [Anneissia japonica]